MSPSTPPFRLPPLATARLDLRELTVDDAPFIRELVNEPGWLRFIGDRGVRSLGDARTYLEQGPLTMYARHGLGLRAMVRRADAALLGICGLLQRDGFPEVDLGYALLARHHGAGYAREAALACLRQGREQRGLQRIVALTAPDNAASIRLLESLGFRFERQIAFGSYDRPSCLFAHTTPLDLADGAERAER